MIINLRTLDCLTNSPCQIHWKYIENSMEEMHVNSGCKALIKLFCKHKLLTDCLFT